MTWPKKVPILDADEIHKGGYGNEGRFCIYGWVCETFPDMAQFGKVWELIRTESGALSVIDWNDSESTERREIANVWNRAIRKLGFTEECARD